LTGRLRRSTPLSACLLLLAFGACSSTTTIDDEELSPGSTFDLASAPTRVAEGMKAFEGRVEAFPDQVSERFSFDEERAIKVDGEGFEITGDTFNYIVNEWLPQVTGSDERAEREAEKAAKAEAERQAQVAAAPQRASTTVVSNGQSFDLSAATPMGGQFVPTRAPQVNPQRALAPLAPSSNAVSKSVPGGLEGVGRFFDQNGYLLDTMRRGAPVPPVFARKLPNDMNNSVPMNKDVFLRLLLPLSIKVNAEIAAERATIERSGYSGPITNAPASVRTIAAKYDIQSNTTNLLQRVDVLPVSLILAQAGLESGWGTSRYVQQGNALFGQRVWDSSQPGMTPSDRDADQNHRVRTFTSLEESIRSYAMNLNTNSAYLEMRKARAGLRRTGRMASARDLIPHLNRYSEDPTYYAATLNTLVNDNRLTDFDRARLSNGQPMNLYL